VRAIAYTGFFVAVGIGLVACNNTPTQPSSSALTISGQVTATAIGQTFQLTATLARTGQSSRDVTAETSWASTESSVATVSASGLVTIVGIGLTRIVATYQSLSATREITAFPPAQDLKLFGNLSLTGVGETSQLQAIATLVTGGTLDVTNHANWITMTEPSIIAVSKGLITANGLGWGQVNASYTGRVAAVPVTVTPPGTYIIRGFVKHPGHAGVAGFNVRDTQSGRTILTSSTGAYAPGWYSLGGLSGSSRLTYNKAGFEPAELVVTGPATNGGGEVKVQEVYRIAAGATVQTTIAPHDVEYNVSPSGPCANCRLIRVVNPSPGTLHLRLTWSPATAPLRLWVDGQVFGGTPGVPLNVDVIVGAGELVLYTGVGTDDLNYVSVTLTTALTAPAPGVASARTVAATSPAPPVPHRTTSQRYRPGPW